MVAAVNLEAGMPTVEVALRRLELGLSDARMRRASAVRLIHGYGSSGRGGAIRDGVHSCLARMKSQGKIREFVPGEEFSPFSQQARHALALCPELSHDRDFARENRGVTLVVL
ncbi:Smr/MutS family protein [uncultured Anaerotruncus sp.]|uniref:Smr/MutS family protein n=1 Tax=uncultured Anaerotruncus sp. TaxID=905011 RepID=UPI00280B6055|nr:Smr/MutS family protein [uncultured Anaerotruncus sp.]